MASKSLWHTIQIKVPAEMIELTKTGARYKYSPNDKIDMDELFKQTGKIKEKKSGIKI